MASLKSAVNAKCKDCSYDSCAPGSWRKQVEECTVYSCALWEVRPVTMEYTATRRKGKGADGVDLDAILDSIDNDDETLEEKP